MSEFYLRYEYWLVATQLTLAMVGMGAVLSLGHFRRIITFPNAFFLGMLLQVAATPALAYALIVLADLPPGLAAGLAVVAVTPGGSLTNVAAHLSGGNSALSVALTACATLLCLVTAPLLLDFLIKDDMPPDFVMPARQIAFDIIAFMLVPLAVGMLLYQAFPKSRVQISKIAIRLSLVVVAMILFGALSSGRIDWQVLAPYGVGVTAGFFLLLVIVTLAAPLIFGLRRQDHAAIQIEVVGRNVNVGLLLTTAVFPATAQLTNGGATDEIGVTAFSVLLLYGGVGTAGMIVVAFCHWLAIKKPWSRPSGAVG